MGGPAIVLPRPLPPDTEEVRRAGAALIVKSCAHCHGAEAAGDGPAGEACDPRPADLRATPRLRGLSDAQLYARLTHGKAHTCMPSFEAALSVDDRLRLVRHLRSLAPP